MVILRIRMFLVGPGHVDKNLEIDYTGRLDLSIDPQDGQVHTLDLSLPRKHRLAKKHP